MSRKARRVRKHAGSPIRETHATSDGRPIRVGSIVQHPALGYFRVLGLTVSALPGVVDVHFASAVHNVPGRVYLSTDCRLSTKEDRKALAVCGPVLLS